MKPGIIFGMMMACGMGLITCSTPANDSSATNIATPAYTTSDLTDSVVTSGIEGPAVDREGNLYVVNYQKQGTIGVIRPDGSQALLVNLPDSSIGNGIRINASGQLYVADYTRHNILEIDPISKIISVFAHNDLMNQPNDLAIRRNGTLFASDPKWSANTGQLWRIDRDGSTHLLADSLGTTNGIEVSPDDHILYVGESAQKLVWAFDIDEAGNLSNRRIFHEYHDFGLDGMRCDVQGNLYVSRYGKGVIDILDPQGNSLREVTMKGKKTSNIAFGGPDGKTCYVTLQDRGVVETFRTEYPGRSWQLLHSN